MANRGRTLKDSLIAWAVWYIACSAGCTDRTPVAHLNASHAVKTKYSLIYSQANREGVEKGYCANGFRRADTLYLTSLDSMPTDSATPNRLYGRCTSKYVADIHTHSQSCELSPQDNQRLQSSKLEASIILCSGSVINWKARE